MLYGCYLYQCLAGVYLFGFVVPEKNTLILVLEVLARIRGAFLIAHASQKRTTRPHSTQIRLSIPQGRIFLDSPRGR
jgi:uncharacterized membrane protein HdeD (DUF308 family)